MEAFPRENAGMFENSHMNNTMIVLVESKRKSLLKLSINTRNSSPKFFFWGVRWSFPQISSWQRFRR